MSIKNDYYSLGRMIYKAPQNEHGLFEPGRVVCEVAPHNEPDEIALLLCKGDEYDFLAEENNDLKNIFLTYKETLEKIANCKGLYGAQAVEFQQMVKGVLDYDER